LGRRDRTGEIVIPPSGYAMMRGISVFKSGNDLELAFEWDKQKAKINQRKHNISFEEASTVFDDPLAVNFDDPDHSTEENRYLIIGLSAQGKLLFISYTDRNHKIRLISARLVTPKERRSYERENPK
jgi:uncharacterized DUF497 family protein